MRMSSFRVVAAITLSLSMTMPAAATDHGAIYCVRDADGKPCVLPLDRRCNLAQSTAL